MTNSTIMTEFLLVGFANGWKLRFLNSMLFLLMYLATMLGNLLIVTVSTIDKNLHTPMYFFLRNLSILDMCYISVTVPNACVNFLTDNRAISVAGCATQIFLVIYCGYVEVMFLTFMARDRYVAICQPLHYPIIMNPRVCDYMTLISVISGLAYSGFHTANTFRLPFCQSNVIHQFFCDIHSLLILSCSDTFYNEIANLVSAMVFGGGCFLLIAMSYFHIFSTAVKFPTSRERGKAFSTCVPHILVVSVFLISGIYVNLKSSVTIEPIHDMILSTFYTIVPPLLNPIIYSLKNKQVKEALRKLILR
ncbi:olfactory receptor 14C36-like [Dasypus novemcinctus]|uniref:olfactory receptor 14C36-like n=1 Tax=Dasypus novemcinctus TaxID=9361 RepID=UPI0026604C55|nr:olfactory receptor 14C36-like [Dasypus novemcinctus]